MKNVPVYFLTAFAKTSLKDASMTIVNLLSANTTKWSNTLKQCVGNVATNCLSVFDHFAGLVLRGLKDAFINSNATDDAFHLQNLKKALLQLTPRLIVKYKYFKTLYKTFKILKDSFLKSFSNNINPYAYGKSDFRE